MNGGGGRAPVATIVAGAGGRPGLVDALPAALGRCGFAVSPDAGGAVVVVGVGASAADQAVRIAGVDPDVVALVLVDPVLGATARRHLAAWDQLALLTVADPADRAALRSAVDARLASRHPATDVWVGPVGDADTDADALARWAAARVAERGVTTEVVLEAVDGWRLHGDLHLPAGASASAPAPGVVLLHSGRTDRAVFDPLARRLVGRGLAVLNLDWRGRGQSTNRGRGYYDIALVDRADGRLDATAAFDHLAGLAAVDGTRLGAVGVAHGAEHAVRGSLGDDRVRAIVALTGFHLAGDDERRRLRDGAVEVLYVTGAAHRATAAAMRELHGASTGRRTRFVEVPGGAIGYQLLELHPHLAGLVADWLVEVLTS